MLLLLDLPPEGVLLVLADLRLGLDQDLLLDLDLDLLLTGDLPDLPLLDTDLLLAGDLGCLPSLEKDAFVLGDLCLLVVACLLLDDLLLDLVLTLLAGGSSPLQ